MEERKMDVGKEASTPARVRANRLNALKGGRPKGAMREKRKKS